ncbi:porin [Paraburkholderia sediminicola]|uniref:porin n=1 Tax=Paraburkholderia sediminicola TaxID=458836 RepID=UPI0038BDBA84
MPEKIKRAVLLFGVLLGVGDYSYAQSNVTLYGIIDDGIQYTNNYGGTKRIAMGQSMQASRWGVKGSEDLGDQWSAVFYLENGFNPSTGALGAGGGIFGKKAIVGLSSPYGTVLLGRQYSSILNWTYPFAVNETWAGGLEAYANDVDDTGGDIHLNNTVRYTSPNFNGFSFGGQYSLGGVAGNFSANSEWGLGTSYLNDNFGIGAAYQHFTDPAAYTAGANTASYTNVYYGKAVAIARGQDIFVTGAYYNVGNWNTAALYSHVRFYAQDGGAIASFNNYQVGANYKFTPAFQLGALYVLTNENSALEGGSSKIHQAAVVADYFLSKTTDIYALGSVVFVHGGIQNAQSTAQVASSTNRQIVASVGIRKKF